MAVVIVPAAGLLGLSLGSGLDALGGSGLVRLAGLAGLIALAALLGIFPGRTGRAGFSVLLPVVLFLARLLFLSGFALVLLPGALLPALAGRALALFGLLLAGLLIFFGGLHLLCFVLLCILLLGRFPALRAVALAAAGTS